MDAKDVIESYVTDVAVRLPRKQRNDVAFELRELLHEEMQGKAEALGRGVDVAMATELVRAFGRPVEVAARYRPTLTIIDPADGQVFVRAAVIGVTLIWCLGLLMHLRPPIEGGVLMGVSRWWGTTVIPSMWWPGVLVVSFGLAAWARRRWPQASEWKPRAGEPIPGGRAAMVLGLIGILCGLFVLLDPRWVLDALFGGRAAPAAYDAFTYTDSFRQRQAPILLVLLMLNIPMLITVIVSMRWSTTLRRTRQWLSLATCAVMAWVVVDGPVFLASNSDRTVKLVMALTVVFTLIDMAIKLHRSVRPAPSQQVRA